MTTYLSLMAAPWAVAQFPFRADATHAEVQQAAGRLAVFELEPDDSETLRSEPGSRALPHLLL